ncbi:hypothetical protein GSI_10429 [Ganoderma sinense ZZ0214-1]|uniref:Uncharacterized protein n=1 Tax=Ganoderma sinense ZZ0214-1 TaxID=1077348 RepID=A0A2G8S0I5_9APHY|nr:hypothetical protein GSI_10429 [Ganoderma sinense ZZ0214-1]
MSSNSPEGRRGSQHVDPDNSQPAAEWSPGTSQERLTEQNAGSRPITKLQSHAFHASPHPALRPSIPLVANRNGVAPQVCKAWEGKVASRGGLDGFVFTSPNMDFVPDYPVHKEVINTNEDGRWGLHEYSRWPQPYVDSMMHLACIPRQPALPHLPRVLFKSLHPSSDWTERIELMVKGLGFVYQETRSELAKAANLAIQRFHATKNVRENVQRYGDFLVMLLRQVVDRMTYVASHSRTAIAVAAHVQRLCLELAGLKTYVELVVPRLESTVDFSPTLLPVLGGFVRDLTDAQTWCRLGLPVWLIQPLTQELVIWRVVDPVGLPSGMSDSPCSPPILHKTGSFVFAPNVTGNWLTSMLMSVSKHLGGSHLECMNLASVPKIPHGLPDNKRARIEEGSTQLAMRAAFPIDGEPSSSKVSRRQRRKQAAAERAALNGTSTTDPSASTLSGTRHPSRTFLPSPFCDPAHVWAAALRSASPLPQTCNSALYFYPPPFLLDTVCAKAPVPEGNAHPERARVDEKVARYLHNLVRIREFCRARLFDKTLSSKPLSIGEWRAALWGDYNPQTSVRAGGTTSDARRAKRRLEERNEVGALLHQVGHMDRYSTDIVVSLEGITVAADTVATNPAVRATLLWESHELNFRAELMALDHLLVNTSDWPERFKWEREMLVSGAWGEPSSGLSVLPSLEPDLRQYCWCAPPDEGWEDCQRFLRAFAQVLSRWHGCPEVVLQVRKMDGKMTADQFSEVQRSAVEFYVRSFTRSFLRLPIPPIPFP